MKVLKRREKHIEQFEEQCDKCDSELQYTREDIKIDHNVYSKGKYVICPVCDNQIVHYDVEDYVDVTPR